MTAQSAVAVAADPATVARILADRARVLAVPLLDGQPPDTVDLVVLTIGAEWYGLDTSFVIEVQPLVGLARLPGVPALWAGITNVRGTLWPVLDQRECLGLPAAEGTRAGRAGPKVALVGDGTLSVALLVDDAVEIRRVPVGQIGPPLAGAGTAAWRQVRGVTSDLLTVLDVAGLLAGLRPAAREEST